MRATLNPQTFRIESDILKLVEFKETQKLLIRLQIEDEFLLLFHLECILKNNFTVS